MFRYIAVGAVPLLCALVGCAHTQPTPPAPATAQAAGQPQAASDSAAQHNPPPVVPDQTATNPPPTGPGSSGATPPRPAAPSKDNRLQSPTAGGSKPKPPAPRGPASGSAAAAPATPTQPAAPSQPATASAATKPNPAGAPAAAPATASLDLTSLEQRLKDTRAIGLFTKLSLKNQVDDLLSQFRAFYARKSAASLGDLRQRYDLLLMKVLSLLQDGDPPLASAISGSREAIWGILSDPQKFAKL
jgi:hypothetical protein